VSRELLLLGLLRRWGTHGYQLMDFLDTHLAFLADLKKPTAYALLERLRRAGHVSVSTERAGNRPERRVYQLTPAGAAHFQHLLRANLQAFAPPRFPDATGLYFLDALPADEAKTLLQERLAAIDRCLAEFRPKVAEHQGLAVHPVLDHYVVHLEADRTWLAGFLGREVIQPGRRR